MHQGNRMVVAVDGCSSTGKSTLARMAARTFGWLYLDSGALYRGVTWVAQSSGWVDAEGGVDGAALAAALPGLGLTLCAGEEGESRLFLDGRCLDSEIRTMAVSAQVSGVAALPFVRGFVDARLRALAGQGSVVMDGRDIGTTVFPDAALKVFVTAAREVRVRRRYEELLAKGQHPDLAAVDANLRERDWQDSHREVSPLRQAPDALVLDNTHLTLREELVWMQGALQGKLGLAEVPLAHPLPDC